MLSIDTQKKTAAINRYNTKVYTQIAIRIPKDLAADFKATTAERGDSQAAVIKSAIEAYIGKK